MVVFVRGFWEMWRQTEVWVDVLIGRWIRKLVVLRFEVKGGDFGAKMVTF